MTSNVNTFLSVVCVVMFSSQSLAQFPEHRTTNVQLQSQEQLPNVNSTDTMAREIELLRNSLQSLNGTLRDIRETLLSVDAKQDGLSKDQQNRISLNLELLSRAEQRAEVLRKQLLELTEKETSLKSRLLQIEEDLRPESIERATTLIGTTRAPELREVRRRVLDNDRKGYESLLNQTSQSRLRLEDDVKQADELVSKLRRRVLPLIDKEIEKINPN